jgi:hypothetical protein
MAALDIDVANLALNHLGLTVNVTTISGTASKEERAIKNAYNVTRRSLIKRYPWKFAMKRAVLVAVDPLVAAQVTTLDDWVAAYVQPTDCLQAVRIVSGVRNEAVSQRTAFEPGFSDTGATAIILCDADSPVLQYRADITDCTKWPPNFDLALSHALASALVMPLKVDANIGKLVWLRARMVIEEALADDRSEGAPDLPPEAQHILDRS